VQAAQTRGEPAWCIMLVEILPNARGPLIVDLCLRLGYVTIAIGTLGFLGVGLPPPTPDWGGMIYEGRQFATVFPHMIVFPCIAGIALVCAFIVHALRMRTGKPLLDIRLYKRPTFSSASFAMFCLGAALFGGMILLPYYWQQVRLESVVNTGLLTAPQGLGAALAMPIAGKLSDRLGGGPLALFGVIVTTVMTIPFALIGAHTSVVWLSFAMFLRGTGIGFAFMPAMAAAFAALDRSELAHATPQLNVLQRVGGSIGTAVLAVVLQRALVGVHSLSGEAGAYGVAFWASAGLSALAIIPCVILLRAERDARRRTGAQGPSDDVMAEALAA